MLASLHNVAGKYDALLLRAGFFCFKIYREFLRLKFRKAHHLRYEIRLEFSK